MTVEPLNVCAWVLRLVKMCFFVYVILLSRWFFVPEQGSEVAVSELVVSDLVVCYLAVREVMVEGVARMWG